MRPLRKLVATNPIVRKHDEPLQLTENGRMFDGLQNLLGASPVMREIFRIAQQAAPSRATMLISGETGTGKGEFARTVHDLSPRANRPFVTVHCAVGQGVLESELFGFEPGSYSTVERSPVGRVEQANGGTLFLDEVAEISPTVQVKLLTMLREGRVERVGGSESIPVDVRVIAATSRDLEREVAAGRFRQDLYYRLNVVQVTMPSLRQRGDDVLLIADYFLKRFALEHRKPIAGVTHGAKIRIRNHLWPGNVRELENAIERAVVMCDGTLIEERHLPRAPNTADASKTLDSLDGELRIPGATLAALERFAILRTLEFVDGATTRAAELLDVSPRTIQYRLHEYGVAKRRREVNPAPETSSDAPLCPPSQRAKPLPRVRARR